MGLPRDNGSVISSNNIAFSSTPRDYGIYQGQVINVRYVDDLENATNGLSSAEVLYTIMIVGGSRDGQVFETVRNICKEAGSNINFSETTLQASESPYQTSNQQNKDPLNQVGDIVYIAFVEGNYFYPVIIGFGVNGLNTQQSTAAQAPRKQSQFNGVQQLIDNNGNWEITKYGGTLDASTPAKPVFKPNADSSSHDGQISINGQTVNINVNSGQVNITVEASNDSVKIKTQGGAELNLVGGKVALGAGGNEVLDLLNQCLTAIQALTVISSAPGAPSSTPINTSTFAQIQSNLNSIKGSL